jgi:hypothetical protein
LADWRHDWLWGAGNSPPPYAGGKTGQTCLVVGPARCVFDDLRVVQDWPFSHRLAVNNAALILALDADGFCTLHPEMAAGMLSTALPMGHPYVPVHGHVDHLDISIPWPFRSHRGTSGLFGAKVAAAMGFDRIVLAGLPFDHSGHYYEPPWFKVTLDNYGHNPRDVGYWMEFRALFGDRVRSLSGNTAEWFGRPTREWFDGQ